MASERSALEGVALRLYKALDGVLPTELPAGPGYTEVPNSRLREGNEALEAWDRAPDSAVEQRPTDPNETDPRDTQKRGTGNYPNQEALQ